MGTNEEGPMFIKYFTVNKQTTSLLFVYLYSLTTILSSIPKLSSISDSLTIYLNSLLSSILFHTEQRTAPSSASSKNTGNYHRTPSSPQSTYTATSDVLHSLHAYIHGVDIVTIGEFCFYEENPCVSKASKLLIRRYMMIL